MTCKQIIIGIFVFIILLIAVFVQENAAIFSVVDFILTIIAAALPILLVYSGIMAIIELLGKDACDTKECLVRIVWGIIGLWFIFNVIL